MINIKMYTIEYDDFIKKYQKEMLKKKEISIDLDSKEILSRLDNSKKKEKCINLNDLYTQKCIEDKILINALTLRSHDNEIFKIAPVIAKDDTNGHIEFLSDDSQCLHYLSVDHFLYLFTAIDLKMLLSNAIFIISTAASLITIITFFKEIKEKMNTVSENKINSKSKYSNFTLKIWKNDMAYEIKCKNYTVDEINEILDKIEKM